MDFALQDQIRSVTIVINIFLFMDFAALSYQHRLKCFSLSHRVLKKKEQRILETEFRIARAVAAREEAQRQAQEEKDKLVAAQNESRMVCSAAQREVMSPAHAINLDCAL